MSQICRVSEEYPATITRDFFSFSSAAMSFGAASKIPLWSVSPLSFRNFSYAPKTAATSEIFAFMFSGQFSLAWRSSAGVTFADFNCAMSSLVSNANAGEAASRERVFKFPFIEPRIFFTTIAALSLVSALLSDPVFLMYLPNVKTSTLNVPPSLFTMAFSIESVSLSSQKTTARSSGERLCPATRSAAASIAA